MATGILAVGGSPRAGGNTDKLVSAAVIGASGSTETESVHLRNYTFHPCVGCEACRKAQTCTKHNDGMTLLYPKIERASGLILACPTHNYNITAWMKAFIDRLYPFYNFQKKRPGGWSSRLADQGRKAAIIAVCEEPHMEGMGFTLDAMRLPLIALGYDIVGELPVLGVFEKGAVTDRPDAMARAEELGKELAQSLLVEE